MRINSLHIMLTLLHFILTGLSRKLSSTKIWI